MSPDRGQLSVISGKWAQLSSDCWPAHQLFALSAISTPTMKPLFALPDTQAPLSQHHIPGRDHQQHARPSMQAELHHCRRRHQYAHRQTQFARKSRIAHPHSDRLLTLHPNLNVPLALGVA